MIGGTGPESVETFKIGADGKFVRNGDGTLQTDWCRSTQASSSASPAS